MTLYLLMNLGFAGGTVISVSESEFHIVGRSLPSVLVEGRSLPSIEIVGRYLPDIHVVGEEES